MPLVVDSDEETPRSSVDETEPLTRETDGGCVYNWQVLLDILRQQSEEQLLISILQGFTGTVRYYTAKTMLLLTKKRTREYFFFTFCNYYIL